MASNDQHKRSEKRAHSTLTLDLQKKGKGITRDVSASGIYFETDATYRLESTIDFEWDFDKPQGTMRLRCHGKIVRIEPRGARVGIAVNITESTIEPIG